MNSTNGAVSGLFSKMYLYLSKVFLTFGTFGWYAVTKTLFLFYSLVGFADSSHVFVLVLHISPGVLLDSLSF